MTTETVFQAMVNSADQPPVELLGQPGFDLFQEWTAAQPGDEDLDRLSAAVQVAEHNYRTLKDRLPEALIERTAAAEAEDGETFARAAATVAGLPARIARAAAERTRANLQYLFRLSVLARAAVTAAESAQVPVTAQMGEIRADLYRDESGLARRENRLPPSDVAALESEFGRLRRQLEPFDVQGRKAREIRACAEIRSELYGPGIDLSMPATWEPAISRAQDMARKEAEGLVRAHGR